MESARITIMDGEPRKGSRKAPKVGQATVWQIANWERWEPKEARRNVVVGPLTFVQLHVRGGYDVDTQQLEAQQVALLARKGGLEAWGVYTLLLKLAGNRSRNYRGYLLDHRNRPASARMIGELVHVPEATVKKALAVLASPEIGMMERVELPDFEAMAAPVSRRARGAGEQLAYGQAMGSSMPDYTTPIDERRDFSGRARAGYVQTPRGPGEIPEVSGGVDAWRPGAPGRAGGNVNTNGQRPTANGQQEQRTETAETASACRPSARTLAGEQAGVCRATQDANAPATPTPTPPTLATARQGAEEQQRPPAADGRAEQRQAEPPPTADADERQGEPPTTADADAGGGVTVRDLPGGVSEVSFVREAEGAGPPPLPTRPAEPGPPPDVPLADRADGPTWPTWPTEADPGPGAAAAPMRTEPRAEGPPQAEADPRSGSALPGSSTPWSSPARALLPVGGAGQAAALTAPPGGAPGDPRSPAGRGPDGLAVPVGRVLAGLAGRVGNGGQDAAGFGVANDPEGFAQVLYLAIYPDERAEAESARHGDNGTPTGLPRFRARERGSFAGTWQAVLRLDLADGELAALYRRAVDEGAKLAKKKGVRLKRTRGAIWAFWLGRHMEKLVGETRWAAAKRGLKIHGKAG
jgi:hypothetical protein